MRIHTIHGILCLILLIAVSSCKTASVKKANAQFDAGNYDAAYSMFQKVALKIPYTKPDLKSEVYIKMGICTQQLQRLQPSENSYNAAIRLKSTDPELRIHLAKLYHRQGKYTAAIKQYELFLEKDPQNPIAKQGIINCQIADTLKKYPTRFIVRPESKLNSRQGEFSPMLYGKEFDQIYFTTYRDQATGKKRNAVTGMKNNDIYTSKKNNAGQWETPKPAEGAINTAAEEGAVSFNGDNSAMYITRCRPMEESSAPAEIYLSKRAEASWSDLQRVQITNDSTELTAHAAISPKGDFIYFVSDRKGGIGGKDIWRARIEGLKFTEVENLGSQINTPGNEMFPYVRENGELYFASDGLPGMGGLDIFRATPLSDGKWKVENLGAPINSNGDDFGITFAGLDENGYFSSNRNDNKGFDHIYAFELPSVKLFVEGIVKTGQNQILPDAQLHIVSDHGTNTRASVKKDGTFKFKAERGIKYRILSSCKGYINSNLNIEVADIEKDSTYRANFSMIPIAKPIQVNNIFYDIDQATLRPESAESLDQLIKLLKENPNITIELSAHTDMNGTEEYNQRLSEERAKSVVEYLIRGGIEKDRLTPKGYGKGSPKTVDATMSEKYPYLKEGEILDEEYIKTLTPPQQEIANQINRRTEFRILKTTYNLF